MAPTAFADGELIVDRNSLGLPGLRFRVPGKEDSGTENQ
jgi:hypothetical protein